MKPGITIVAFFLTTLVATAAEDADSMSGTAMLMPAYLLEMPETVTDVLIASAGTATMHRFVRNGSTYVEKDSRYMSIGQNGAGKQRAWDKKTPLGVYFITERLDTTRLHDKYGVAAFPLDYPNAWDRHQNRTGYGIWLHGVDHKNPDRPPLDTDGCLSLPNEEILALADDLQPLVTPVIVARTVNWASREQLQELRTEFRLALDMWRDSLASGDLQSYLAFYADDFSYRNLDRAEWAAWRMEAFRENPLSGIELQDLMLVADPEVENLFLSRFTQVLQTANGPVSTTKRLYWRRNEHHRWEIVAEGAG